MSALVLLYHRVAEVERDPHRIVVRPDRFREHVELLARRFELVPLGRVRERAQAPRIVLTFDDGYVDNLTAAVPVLEAAGAPATIFVVSGAVGGGEFWWDRLERISFDALPGRERVELDVAGRPLLADLRTPAALERAHEALYRRLRPLPPAAVEAALDSLAAQLGADGSPRARAVTEDELRALAASPSIEIGAHTVAHPLLTGLPGAERDREIVAGRARLEQLTGAPVPAFSYPHGDVDAAVELAVKRAGFALACHTEEGAVSRFTPRHRLPRLTVLDWDGAELLRRIGRWLPT